MKPAGGLKLQLGTASHDDRRARFAAGRLRYRLPAGEYRLRFEEGPDTPFTVDAHGWTAVRVPLS
jgi:hypothetical protein